MATGSTQRCSRCSHCAAPISPCLGIHPGAAGLQLDPGHKGFVCIRPGAQCCHHSCLQCPVAGSSILTHSPGSSHGSMAHHWQPAVCWRSPAPPRRAAEEHGQDLVGKAASSGHGESSSEFPALPSYPVGSVPTLGAATARPGQACWQEPRAATQQRALLLSDIGLNNSSRARQIEVEVQDYE